MSVSPSAGAEDEVLRDVGDELFVIVVTAMVGEDFSVSAATPSAAIRVGVTARS